MEKPIEKTPYVFVYGTLMSNFSNSHLLSSAEFIDRASTEKEYKLVASGIPFLLDEPGNSYILGELYKVDESTLGLLDELEGHPDWYVRQPVSIISEVGDKYKAWVYFMPKDKLRGGAQTIENGSFADYAYSHSKY